MSFMSTCYCDDIVHYIYLFFKYIYKLLYAFKISHLTNIGTVYASRREHGESSFHICVMHYLPQKKYFLQRSIYFF